MKGKDIIDALEKLEASETEVLRDWLAIMYYKKALYDKFCPSPENLALTSYEYAEAMILERKKGWEEK